MSRGETLRILNLDLIRNIYRIFKHQNSQEDFQEDIPVIASIDITRIPISRDATSNNLSGNSIIYTIPSDRDFYLTGANLSRTKDAVADTTSSSLRVTLDGQTRSVIYMSGITTTTQVQDISREFYPPIKCDRGTTIVMNASRTVGTTNHSGAIQGYEE